MAILLTASIKELSQRLIHDKGRPLLYNQNIIKILKNIWLERKMDYLNTANITIETGGKTPVQVAEEILMKSNNENFPS